MKIYLDFYSQSKREGRNVEVSEKMLFDGYFSTITFEEERLLVPYHGTAHTILTLFVNSPAHNP